MKRSRVFVLLGVLWLISWGGATQLHAQGPVRVQPRRDLSIGFVFAGVPKSISHLDPANSGMYRIRGRRNAEITLTFTLPPTLVSGSGQTLDIQFGSSDAGYSPNQNQPASIPFDPQVPLTIRLGPRGRLFVWLGGTADPGSNQPAGFYQAAVVLTAAYTGN